MPVRAAPQHSMRPTLWCRPLSSAAGASAPSATGSRLFALDRLDDLFLDRAGQGDVGDDRVVLLQHDDAGGNREVANVDRVADHQLADVVLERVRDVAGQGLDREREERLLEQTAVADALGLADELDRHLGLDRLVGAHADEVDVQHGAAHGVAVHLAGQRELVALVDLQGDQRVAATRAVQDVVELTRGNAHRDGAGVEAVDHGRDPAAGAEPLGRTVAGLGALQRDQGGIGHGWAPRSERIAARSGLGNPPLCQVGWDQAPFERFRARRPCSRMHHDVRGMRGRQPGALAKFCCECGAPFAAPERREERKVVSVLFADLVGFTSRSEQLDVEDVRGTLAPFHATLRRVLESFGGTVEKFIGDAVMAVFGAPVAHEDDAERAVRAGLAIREAIADLGDDLHVRIGINTGEALVSVGADPQSGEGMVAGDVVNTAARLQSAAPIDGVLVGEATYRSAAREIVFEAHEPIDAKGKAEPVACWIAIEPRSFVPIPARDRTPFVGRARELRLLIDAFEHSRAERSVQLVTVVGVPGIGKEPARRRARRLSRG